MSAAIQTPISNRGLPAQFLCTPPYYHPLQLSGVTASIDNVRMKFVYSRSAYDFSVNNRIDTIETLLGELTSVPLFMEGGFDQQHTPSNFKVGNYAHTVKYKLVDGSSFAVLVGRYDYLVCNSKVIQISLKAILGGETGVHKEAFFVVPLFKAPVVEQFQIVLYDEGDDIILQAFFEENQAAYTAISVLEGMDAFKGHMESYDVLKGLRGQCIILCQQFANLTGNIFGECGIITAHLVGQLFVFTHSEPILAAVAGTGLQYKMQFLDELLSQRSASLADYHINAAKVVRCFDHMHQKIEMAKKIISAQQDVLFKDVAAKVGIEQSYFSTVFHRMTGLYPSEYKALQEGRK